MRRALVLMLLIVGIGAAALSAPISGYVEVHTWFDKGGLDWFDMLIEVDYTISGVVFGATAVFDYNSFEHLSFTADGPLGPLDVHSALVFDPALSAQTPTFLSWASAATLDLGGVSLFGLAAVQVVDTSPLAYGVGARVGLSGVVGDLRILAASYFNMFEDGASLYYYGYDWLTSHLVYDLCGEWLWWDLVEDDECSLAWDSAMVYVDFPFACLDVSVWLGMNCEGFGGIRAIFNGIETGLSWLAIDELWIDFEEDAKYVRLTWDVVLADLFCITPYFSLEGAGYTVIDGLTLNALLLEYSYNGVTVKAGEIFDNTWLPGYLSSGPMWGFTLDGTIAQDWVYGWPVLDFDCVYSYQYDEFIGIWLDGDSCCGGTFDVSVISFFVTSVANGWTTYPAIFDWAETVMAIDVVIGTNSVLGLSLSVYDKGLFWFGISVGFSF